MVPMARIFVVGVVFIAAPCAFAELKPTRQPISANAAAETNFMLYRPSEAGKSAGQPQRRTARGGRDSIDHAPGAAHDDIANAVSGVVGAITSGVGTAWINLIWD